jgi:hypothetical protein
MTCPDCSTTTDPTQGCKGCAAQSLARLFLAKGERGQRFRRACEQLGVTPEQVQAAHQTMQQDPPA